MGKEKERARGEREEAGSVAAETWHIRGISGHLEPLEPLDLATLRAAATGKP